MRAAAAAARRCSQVGRQFDRRMCPCPILGEQQAILDSQRTSRWLVGMRHAGNGAWLEWRHARRLRLYAAQQAHPEHENTC